MDLFPPPDSLPIIPKSLLDDLYVMSSLGTLSLLTTFGTLAAVAYQYLRGYRNHADQLLVPILQLLVVDFLQALGFTLSWHWVRTGSILAPTAICTCQGILINFGDVANALCILFIALETLYRYKYGRQPSRRTDYSIALGIFGIAFTMTIIGPIQHGKKYYVRVNAVVSTSSQRVYDRLIRV